MTDEQKRAQAEYEAAFRALAQVKPNDNGSEQAYGVAYQRLVMLGMAMPLKKKYRGR